MRLFFSSIVAISAATLLVGCGFTPLHSTNVHTGQKNNSLTQSSALLPVIALPKAASQQEYLLHTALERKIGNQSGNYHITWIYKQNISGTALNQDSDYTRYNSMYTARWQLFDANGKSVLRKTAQTTIALDVMKTGYPTIAAQKKADENAANILADQIYRDLAIHFKSRGMQ